MLGLSWTEMLVIGIVALIFIGPKDLPVVMGKAGKVIGQIQRMGREFQREINKTTGLDEVRNLRSSIANPLKQTADEIRKEFNAIGKDGKQTPTGVIKPSDPKVESVADEIRAKAGMPPAAKSSTELAKEYGFKETQKPATEMTASATELEPIAKPAPVKAVRKRVTKPAHVATADGISVAQADTEPVPVVTKPALSKRTAKAATAVGTEDVPKKPRAPRKKPADTAGES